MEILKLDFQWAHTAQPAAAIQLSRLQEASATLLFARVQSCSRDSNYTAEIHSINHEVHLARRPSGGVGDRTSAPLKSVAPIAIASFDPFGGQFDGVSKPAF